MGCSTFSQHTVLPEIALAKVRKDAPFDKICYIGCGVTTGIGAVLYTAKVEPGANVVVFGLGGIGLNVVQGARMAGADKIIGVDLNPAREALARKFGLTHFVNPKQLQGDLVAAPGRADRRRRRLQLRVRGQRRADAPGAGVLPPRLGRVVIIGVAGAGQEIRTRPFQLVTGRVWKGTAFGGARGRTDVPKIVDWYMDGKIDIDSLITHKLPLDAHQRGVRPDARRAVDPHRRRVRMTAALETLSRAALLRGRAGLLPPPVAGRRRADALRRCSSPPQAAAVAAPGAVLPGRADLHRGDLRHQGGRAADARRRSAWCWSPATPARASTRYPGDDASWDFGQGAGFYVDATQAPWRESYRMDSYVTRELPALVEQHFPVRAGRARHLRALDGRTRRAGAGAAQPRPVPQRLGLRADGGAVAGALGPEGLRRLPGRRPPPPGRRYDACDLVRAQPLPSGAPRSTSAPPTSSWSAAASRSCSRRPAPRPASACTLRRQAGYDHSYYFIATFVDDHLAHHARALSP